MPATARFSYQPCMARACEALRAGTPVVCRTTEEIRRTKRTLAGDLIVGERIVRMLHDDDADGFGASERLGELGRALEKAARFAICTSLRLYEAVPGVAVKTHYVFAALRKAV